VQAALELLGLAREHWEACHTPDKGRMPPPWLQTYIAASYGQAMAWAGAIDVSGTDRRGFVFGLFWMRQQLLGIGYDPLKGEMSQRPMVLEQAADAPVDPLVIQGRIEAYEDLLRGGAVILSDVAERLKREMLRYQASVDSVGPPVEARQVSTVQL